MKRMMFLKKMVAMMAMVFSVAMFAACSDDDNDDPGTGGNEPGGSDSTAVVVESITFDPAAITLAAGTSDTLVPVITPAEATGYTLSWESANPEVVSVDTAGVITALALSETPVEITVSVEGTELSATCAVTVELPKGLQVGDYVYMDGSTSSHFEPVKVDKNNPVFGVVYYVFDESEVPQDEGLTKNYSIKWRGLALQISANYMTRWSLGFEEYAKQQSEAGNIPTYEMNVLFDVWLAQEATKDYPHEIKNTEIMNGYSNTKIYQDFNDNSKWEAVRTVYPEDKVEEGGASEQLLPVRIVLLDAFSLELGGLSPEVYGWGTSYYIPSALEWREIGLNIDIINKSLASIPAEADLFGKGGVELVTEYAPSWECAYWTSTAVYDDLYGSFYYNDVAYCFDASSGSVAATTQNERNARIAFAF